LNEYEKIYRNIRSEVSKVTLEQQRHILKLYEDSIKEISKNIAKSKRGSLNERFLIENRKAIKQARNELNRELNKSIRGFTTKAARLSTKGEQTILKGVFDKAGIKVKPTFNSLFTQVQNNVINDIIKGNLYKDNKTLSNRIWSYGKGFEHDIQYTINQAILQKKSAKDLADDLLKYVKNPNQRGKEFSDSYPLLTSKQVQYKAIRLARTSINHAYQTATAQSSVVNPFIEGIQWHSANVHGRTCELCLERDGQIYSVEDLPLDHANGWCWNTPVISKTSDEVATELREWLDGGNNSMLDKWYKEHGSKFI